MKDIIEVTSVCITGAIIFFVFMIGIEHMFSDYRHFDKITKQCTEQGFIQNETVRISCSADILNKTQ